jgi:hypothetical protein
MIGKQFADCSPDFNWGCSLIQTNNGFGKKVTAACLFSSGVCFAVIEDGAGFFYEFILYVSIIIRVC